MSIISERPEGGEEQPLRAARGGRNGLTQRQQRRLDLAARAAWLYYVAGKTQDEIAARLNVSRPGAQRLVSLAVAEGLIKFRIDHPIAACVELSERLRVERGLDYCEVVPGDPDSPDGVTGIAVCAAERIESYLSSRVPTVMAFGTGRTLRAAVAQVTAMDNPQHKIVSLVGNLTRDGRASPYDVVMRLADRVGAQCYPLPTPVVIETAEAKALLQAQRPFQTIRGLVSAARVAFVGVGGVGWNEPLHKDGFVTDEELAALLEHQAVGEICGWAFDAEGRLIRSPLSERLGAVPLSLLPERSIVAVACGRAKVPAIAAALRGRLIAGLITDEATAHALLAA
jgi:DNA-binding transcriptional regulator LsrR (DeoR family)